MNIQQIKDDLNNGVIVSRMTWVALVDWALERHRVLYDDPRITAFYKLRDVAERDNDLESANIINAAIGDVCAWYR